MQNGQLLSEEYTALKSGIDADRKRYDQMLVLAITGILTVLGLSDKIPNKEIIPYLTSPFLVIVTLVAALSKQHQFFKTAFIIEAYEEGKISKIKYEQAYTSIFSSYKILVLESKSKEKRCFIKCILNKIYLAIKRLVSAVFDPFTFLAIFSSAESIYFGRKFIINASLYVLWSYVLGLVVLHIFIFLTVLRQKSLNLEYYRSECKIWLNRNSAK